MTLKSSVLVNAIGKSSARFLPLLGVLGLLDDAGSAHSAVLYGLFGLVTATSKLMQL